MKKIGFLFLMLGLLLCSFGCDKESPTEAKTPTDNGGKATIKAPTVFLGKDTIYAIVNDSSWGNFDFFFNNPYGTKPVSIDTSAKQFAINGFQRKKTANNSFVDSYINFWMYPYDKSTGNFDSTKSTRYGKLSYRGTYTEDYGFTYTVQKSQLTVSLYDASKNRAAGIFEIITKRSDGKTFTVIGFFEGGDKK